MIKERRRNTRKESYGKWVYATPDESRQWAGPKLKTALLVVAVLIAKVKLSLLGRHGSDWQKVVFHFCLEGL